MLGAAVSKDGGRERERGLLRSAARREHANDAVTLTGVARLAPSGPGSEKEQLVTEAAAGRTD